MCILTLVSLNLTFFFIYSTTQFLSFFFFFSSRRRHTRYWRDWSSDVCSSDVFLSASETHNRKNVNRSIEESLSGLERVLPRAREAGLRCEGVISVAFGCPYEGHVPRERVWDVARRLRDAGAAEIGFGDTTGMANPLQVRRFFVAAREALGADVELTAHFHNTRGQGLANVLAALEGGCDSFESSFGELGGCPVPKGATGNIATEDLVSMLHEMEVATGIDLERVVAMARRAQEVLGRPLGSHTLVAGPVIWNGWSAPT